MLAEVPVMMMVFVLLFMGLNVVVMAIATLGMFVYGA